MGNPDCLREPKDAAITDIVCTDVQYVGTGRPELQSWRRHVEQFGSMVEGEREFDRHYIETLRINSRKSKRASRLHDIFEPIERRVRRNPRGEKIKQQRRPYIRWCCRRHPKEGGGYGDPPVSLYTGIPVE